MDNNATVKEHNISHVRSLENNMAWSAYSKALNDVHHKWVMNRITRREFVAIHKRLKRNLGVLRENAQNRFLAEREK